MTFSTLALTLAIAGAGTSVYGQVRAGQAAKKEGKAARRAAESQAELAEYNAAVADVQARDARERGDIEAHRFRARTRALVGEQRTGFAAGNIDVAFGSAVDVQADATLLGELDALTAKNNALREAWGYKVEATDLRTQAEIARKEGVYAEAAGRTRATSQYIGAVGSGLSAGGSILEAKYGFGRSK